MSLGDVVVDERMFLSFSSLGSRFHARGAATERTVTVADRRSVHGETKVAIAGSTQRRA